MNDIIHPLLLLLALSLPYRITTNISPVLDGLAVRLKSWLDGTIPFFQQVTQFLTDKVFGFSDDVKNRPITTFIGDSYLIAPPAPFAMFKQMTTGELTAIYGGIRLENIVIESLDIKIPTLLVDGGLPDRLSLSIKLASLRLPTFDYVSNMFTGLMPGKALPATEDPKPPSTITETPATPDLPAGIIAKRAMGGNDDRRVYNKGYSPI
jgi:hypothetical protein